MPNLAATLSRSGFAVHRGAVSQALCAALRRETSDALDAACWRPSYHIGRFLGVFGIVTIRNPWRRHALSLALTPNLTGALAGMARGLVSAGLPQDARLVEFSAAITFPGATAQELHSDIPAHTVDHTEAGQPVAPLVTAWLAMGSIQDVSQGPTMVIPGTHQRYVRRSGRLAQQAKEDAELEDQLMENRFDSDIRLFVRDQIQSNPHTLKRRKEASEADDSWEEQEFGKLQEPQPLLLEAGSMGIMDCRLAHYGSALPRLPSQAPGAAPQEPRMLLNATFASSADAHGITGFTYHRHGDLPAVTLGEILADKWPLPGSPML